MRLSELNGNDYNKFYEFFISLDFTDDQFAKIFNNRELKIYDDKIIMANTVINFKYLLDKLYNKDKGYDPDKIRKLMIYNSKLLTTSKKTMEDNWQNLLDLSISDSVVSIAKNDNNNFLHFNDNDIKKMVENRPDVICTDINNIVSRIIKLKEFGYTKEQIIYMIPIAPSLLTQNYEAIKNKISFLADLKYNKKDIIQITSTFPSYYDYSFEALDERFFLLETLNLHETVIERPYIIKQSPKLTYARYMYFLDNNISIAKNNRKIFLQEKLFSKIYNITKEELLEKYDYQKFQEEKAKIFVNKQKKY